MKINNTVLNKATFFYLYIPVIIFIFGWSRLLFAVPAVTAIGIAVCLACRNIEFSNTVSLSGKTILIVFVISILTGVCAGWGGITPQAYDWSKHNAVFRDLISKHWPVIYENNGVKSMLTYYLAQYMVPSCIGKICLQLFAASPEWAFIISEMAMLLWNGIGLTLALLNTMVYLRAADHPVKVSACFIMFGSLLAAGRLVLSEISGADLPVLSEGYQHNLSPDMIGAQYTTNFAQLRWVFPQCIAAWNVMSLFLQKNIKLQNYVVLGMPLILFSCFPFLGILPFFVADALRKFAEEKDFSKWIKECFSIQNILILCSVGTFAVLYFGGYIQAEKPSDLSFQINYFTISSYIVFIFASFACYMILLFPLIHREIIGDKLFFWVTAAVLTVLPLYRMGAANDFTMRVSIPALYVLSCYYIQALMNEEVRKRKCYFAILMSAYLAGIIYPAMEIEEILITNDYSNHQELTDEYYSLEYYANPDLKRVDVKRFYLNNGYIDVLYNYFSYDSDMNLFMDTIGKQNN